MSKFPVRIVIAFHSGNLFFDKWMLNPDTAVEEGIVGRHPNCRWFVASDDNCVMLESEVVQYLEVLRKMLDVPQAERKAGEDVIDKALEYRFQASVSEDNEEVDILLWFKVPTQIYENAHI